MLDGRIVLLPVCLTQTVCLAQAARLEIAYNREVQKASTDRGGIGQPSAADSGHGYNGRKRTRHGDNPGTGTGQRIVRRRDTNAGNDNSADT